MRLCRLLLILAVLLLAYCGAVVFTVAFPWSLVVPLVILARRGKAWYSWAHGSARWASASDLKGMTREA